LRTRGQLGTPIVGSTFPRANPNPAGPPEVSARVRRLGEFPRAVPCLVLIAQHTYSPSPGHAVRLLRQAVCLHDILIIGRTSHCRGIIYVSRATATVLSSLPKAAICARASEVAGAECGGQLPIRSGRILHSTVPRLTRRPPNGRSPSSIRVSSAHTQQFSLTCKRTSAMNFSLEVGYSGREGLIRFSLLINQRQLASASNPSTFKQPHRRQYRAACPNPGLYRVRP